MEINNTKNLYCEKCSLKFDKKYAFDLHLSLKHGQKIHVKTEPEIYTEKSHVPQMSEKSFSDHVESEKPYNFETDNSKNEAKTRLKNQSESHSSGKKSFECIVCSVCFSNKVLLKRHMSSVHEKKKAFECEICNTGFSGKPQLKTHISSVHEGIKPFKCNICNTGFSQKPHLKTHISSVHEGIKPFKCNLCDGSFTSKQNMNKHISSVHQGVKHL